VGKSFPRSFSALKIINLNAGFAGWNIEITLLLCVQELCREFPTQDTGLARHGDNPQKTRAKATTIVISFSATRSLNSSPIPQAFSGEAVNEFERQEPKEILEFRVTL
jgi:hypothetical protein